MVDLERRTVLAAGAAIATGLVATTGCQQSERGSAQPGKGPATIKKADIPVGGGRVIADKNFVVTQPVAGTYCAFVKICPHGGCSVSSVDAAGIHCNCHGSRFDATSGAVTNGPAKSGLGKATVTDMGETLEISA